MRVTEEVYMRRLREKLKVLATWARVMRTHREKRKRQQRARERWARAIEKVRRRVREERARAEGGQAEDAGGSSSGNQNEGPSEGRGAQRGAPVAQGAYKESREWTRREGRQEPKRRMATKDGARVGIRMWWWLAEGSGCSVGPIGIRRPRVGDG